MDVDANIPELALSIRQPWATLVVLGLKTIEIRRWPTPIRGRVYIHAGKITDDRPEGWSRIPEEHFALTARRGGIIGAVSVIDCLTYTCPRDFIRDRQLHFNEPTWFVPPRLFGFRFEKAKIETFRAISGQVKFFPVPAMPATIAEKQPERTTHSTRTKKLVKFELDPNRIARPRKRSKK